MMAHPIGFMAEYGEQNGQQAIPMQEGAVVPKKSVVKVCFPGRGAALAYYNDRFDLHKGDLVYVDGKMEGIQGRVVDVSCHFKIKVSDYQKVTAVADTRVKGELFLAGSCFVAFDGAALPYHKVRSWFMAPPEEEGYEIGYDDASVPLSDISLLDVSAAIAQRGRTYYLDNKVRCLSLEGNQGRAIVEGTEAYEVEFRYENGQIDHLICSCPCTCHCKHEVAALLQLEETLRLIETHYPAQFARTGCFTAVSKPALYLYAIDSRETGSIQL